MKIKCPDILRENLSNDLKISGHFLYWMFSKGLSYFAYFLQAFLIDQLYLSAVDNN